MFSSRPSHGASTYQPRGSEEGTVHLSQNADSDSEISRAMNDPEETIQLLREAVDVTVKGHPDRARHLDNLGDKLMNRYLQLGDIDDLKEAIGVLREAINVTVKNYLE